MTAAVSLGRADLALLADPVATRVRIPYLTSLTRPSLDEGVFIRFEGDTAPTMWRGEGRSDTLDVGILYPRKDQAARLALVHLIRVVAPAAFDAKLLLRLHIDDATSLPGHLQALVETRNVLPVGVLAVTETAVGAAAMNVTFTATVLEHDFEV